MSEFHFLRPAWFLALLPALMLLVLLWRRGGHAVNWQGVISPVLLPHLLLENGNSLRRFPLLALGLGWLLAVTALAGPTWERQPQPVYRAPVDRIVVLTDGVLFADRPNMARALSTHVRLDDLFATPTVVRRRDGRTERLTREHGHYVDAEGRRARPRLNDHYAEHEAGLGAPLGLELEVEGDDDAGVARRAQCPAAEIAGVPEEAAAPVEEAPALLEAAPAPEAEAPAVEAPAAPAEPPPAAEPPVEVVEGVAAEAPAPLVEEEEPAVGPDVGAVVGHENGYVTEQQNTTVVCITP